MDLGIKGKTAIVCGGSRGLGRGSAEKLAEAGVNIVLNARSEAPLREAAQEIAERYGVEVRPVAGAAAPPEGRARLVVAGPAPDIMITHAGGPPPGMWREWSEAAWQNALRANMLASIYLITAVLYGMLERRSGRIVNV